MSYSYECNVICDGCQSACVAGEPADNIISARRCAAAVAKMHQWSEPRPEDQRWLCPDCAFKDHIHEPDQP